MVSDKPLPICIVSDAPNLPTGLARIARDLTALLYGAKDELGIVPIQLGYGYDGSPWPWAVYPMINEAYWGKDSLAQVARWIGEVPVVFTVWDAGRCFGLLEGAPARDLWGYFPIDSHNPHGKIGGPGAETVRMYQRVIAYGEYGSRVMKETRGEENCAWLPHGIDLEVFDYEKADEFLATEGAGTPNTQVGDDHTWDWLNGLREAGEAGILVGGVATNQPRKDLALFFATAAKLRQRWPHLRLWLHSDREITEAWSIPELAEVFGFNNSTFTLTTHRADDFELACAYALCNVTLAVGAGEGFGYPIVESLACGTPVIHGDWAGGAELIANPHWKIPSIALQPRGSTCLLRPVYSPEDWAEAAADAIRWGLKEPAVVRAYCRGSVAHLGWPVLAGRWLSWFRRGIEEQRQKGAAQANVVPFRGPDHDQR